MAAPYILARSFQEAHAFARNDLGLTHGHYRVVTSAGTLKAVWNVDLYLVPGWRRRFDGFTMASALKWTRMNVIDVEKQRAEEPATPPTETVVTEVPDGLNPPGVQTAIFVKDESAVSITPEEATAFFDLPSDVDAPLDTPGGSFPDFDSDQTPVAEQAEEPAKPEVKRRRRRCSECGNLHFKGDPCITEAV